jgi:hypothetical protein
MIPMLRVLDSGTLRAIFVISLARRAPVSTIRLSYLEASPSSPVPVAIADEAASRPQP